MARQYFKDVDEPEQWETPSGSPFHKQNFTFTAVGDPAKDLSGISAERAVGDENAQFHPYASLGGTFTSAIYRPNFDNRTSDDIPNSTRASGLSQHALRKARNQTTFDNDTPDDRSYAAIRSALMARHNDANNTIGSPEHNDYLKTVNSGYYDKLEKDAIKKASTHPYFQQDTLFDTEPSKIYVNDMFSDPSMTTSAVTLGALAKQHFGASEVVASSDLSPFSSKLAKNAEKRGLVRQSEGNPRAEVTNGITLSPMLLHERSVNDLQSARIPDSEVASARSSLRESLRGNKVVRNNTPVTPKGLSNQFLPGMEGFV